MSGFFSEYQRGETEPNISEEEARERQRANALRAEGTCIHRQQIPGGLTMEVYFKPDHKMKPFDLNGRFVAVDEPEEGVTIEYQGNGRGARRGTHFKPVAYPLGELVEDYRDRPDVEDPEREAYESLQRELEGALDGHILNVGAMVTSSGGEVKAFDAISGDYDDLERTEEELAAGIAEANFDPEALLSEAHAKKREDALRDLEEIGTGPGEEIERLRRKAEAHEEKAEAHEEALKEIATACAQQELAVSDGGTKRTLRLVGRMAARRLKEENAKSGPETQNGPDASDTGRGGDGSGAEPEPPEMEAGL